MITVVDEILAESTPSFKITNNTTGEVLYENVSIELITQILQSGTPLAKALFDSIAKDFEDIINGVTTVGKAQKDANGNDISNTYTKSSELSEVAFSGNYNDLSNTPSMTVDTTLDKESNNAISISAVATSLETINTTLSQVNETLASKQDTLTIDLTPTSGSTNPVSSGGVYAVIGNLETILSQI